MKKLILFISLGLFLLACSENKKEETGNSNETTKEVSESKFGVSVNKSSAITLTKMESSLKGNENLETTVKGKISKVCQVKGCWMTLEKEDGSEMRVTFKDYALFMPKDIAGKEVVIHGLAEIKTTTVDELKHYAQDAGKPQDEIDAIKEPVTKVSFEADGVEIL